MRSGDRARQFPALLPPLLVPSFRLPAFASESTRDDDLKLSQQAKTNTAVLLLVVSAMASLALGAVRTLPHAIEPSKTELFGRRMAPLQSRLPGRGVVGYVTDPALPLNPRLWQFYQMQYFLAPQLIELGAEHDTVIGIFAREVVPAWLAGQGVVVEKDLGNGIMILRRRTYR